MGRLLYFAKYEEIKMSQMSDDAFIKYKIAQIYLVMALIALNVLRGEGFEVKMSMWSRMRKKMRLN